MLGIAMALPGAADGQESRTGSVQDDQPAPPPVSDPMLAPPPGPPRSIGSWDEALTLIRAQSADYLSNYETIVRAQAQTRIALAAILPQLNGQASYTHQFVTDTIVLGGAAIVTPPPDVFGAGATLAWSIVNPRSLYGVGTAEKNVDVAKSLFADRRRQIASGAVGAILSTLATARVAELNRAGLRSALERLALTQARLQFGQGTALDVDRGEQDVAAARSLIVTGDENLLQSREALGVSLGSPIPIAVPADLDLEQFEGAVARTCRLNDTIERRPDIAAARGRLEVAERSVRDAELLFVPYLNVASQAGYTSAVTFGPRSYWTVQGVLNVPLFDGGARYGALRDSRAAVEQARQALTLTRLNAIVASTQAARAVAVTSASRQVAMQQRDLAARIDRRTREGYARGLGTSLDLVTSAQALRQAEINLAVLEFQLGDARANAVLVNAECLY
ncbi:MAG: TolC family protein [Myxococcota bacterium]|nr:TolC family protein [Myxococcota bacterium]